MCIGFWFSVCIVLYWVLSVLFPIHQIQPKQREIDNQANNARSYQRIIHPKVSM